MLIDGYNYQSGQPIRCQIKNKEVIGKIHLEQDRAYICHDNANFCGSAAPNKWGHFYSWVFYFQNDRYTDDVSDLSPLLLQGINWKQNTISEELYYVLENTIDKNRLQISFNTCLKPFENFKEVIESEKPGYIVLKGKVKTDNGYCNKKVEIKISRYLKKISDSYVEVKKDMGEKIDPLFTDTEIESIFNKFIAHANGQLLNLTFFSGNEINFGYNSKKYAKNSGTLSKSCMSDKMSFLGIYKNNSKCRLAAINNEQGIEARCLVWEIDGVNYFDRIYSTRDWLALAMSKILTDKGFKDVKDFDILEIELENSIFEQYPYIDSFKYNLDGTNKFYHINDMRLLPKGSYRYFGSTGGNFSIYQKS